MKEVWIPGLNKHRFLRFYFPVYSLVFFRLRRYIKHLRQCSIGCPNTSNFVHVVFSTLFLVFENPDKKGSSCLILLRLDFQKWSLRRYELRKEAENISVHLFVNLFSSILG